MKAADGTKIAGDLQRPYGAAISKIKEDGPLVAAFGVGFVAELIERTSASEERVRVLREALSAARVHIADCDCINSACGEDCIYKFIDAALATPAPEQPAEKEHV